MTAPDRLVADRYRLRRRLGGGGMGTVWLADDERLGRQVAVKEVLPPPGTDPAAVDEQRERTLREGRIAARLSHPHAISVYDVAVDDDRPWLVMEYLPSRSLATVLAEDGIVRVDQAAQIGAQVADALVATHGAGIVHRDVKPGNVLIGSGERIEGLVKITDFGISHAQGDVTLTQTGHITGTPAYLAPEVARGEDPGPAADVFSLGATLYTCLEGEPPFGRGDNALEQLHRVAAGTIDPPQRCGALTGVVLAMLAADPPSRPDMAEVRDELVALATGGGGDATAVLAAPTDITTQDLPGPGETPTATSAVVTDAVADADPAAAPAGEAGGASRRPRAARWALAAAVVVAALVGVAAWALVDDGGGDTDIAADPTTTVAAGTSGDADDDVGGDPAPSPQGGPDVTVDSPADAATPGGGGEPEPSGTEPDERGPIGTDAQVVERLLDDYHRSVVDDPVTAYEQAGPTLQGSISLADFEAFWGRFDDVAIRDVDVDEGGDSAVAVMELRFPDGTSQVERHRFGFVVEDDRLVLDRDEFVDMIEPRR